MSYLMHATLSYVWLLELFKTAEVNTEGRWYRLYSIGQIGLLFPFDFPL